MCDQLVEATRNWRFVEVVVSRSKKKTKYRVSGAESLLLVVDANSTTAEPRPGRKQSSSHPRRCCFCFAGPFWKDHASDYVGTHPSDSVLSTSSTRSASFNSKTTSPPALMCTKKRLDSWWPNLEQPVSAQ